MQRPRDEIAVIGSTTVATRDNTTATTTWVNMANFEEIFFVINTTDANADTTVDAKVQSADDNAGTNAADITGLAITQGTAAATAEQYVLSVRKDQLNGDDDHVAVVVTAGNGTTGVVLSVVVLGWRPQYQPASDYDVATLIEWKDI